MKRIYTLSAALVLLMLLASCKTEQSNDSWTHFRGNALNGISVQEEMPLLWNDSLNIEWKTPVPGKGWSSPVILDGQVWLTTATARGSEMRAICLDQESGNILHDILLFEPDSLFRIHAVNSYATPTPALEDGRVYVHFGRYGTACLESRSGKVLWKRSDLQVEHIQGPGSSLLIHGQKLIVHLEGSDRQYILALDKDTGSTIWQVERPAELYEPLDYIGKKAYTTAIVVEAGGRELLISNGSAVCIAYDPETGKEVWRIIYGEDSTISMPTESGGLLYFYTAFESDSSGEKSARLLAVDPDGQGDITDSHIVWSLDSPILQLLSPIVVDGLLYTIDSESHMRCLEATSGKELWSRKLKGKFHSSPVYADGKLYFSSVKGETYVMQAGSEAVELALNRVSGSIWATPAIADHSLFLRSSEYLYRISE